MEESDGGQTVTNLLIERVNRVFVDVVTSDDEKAHALRPLKSETREVASTSHPSEVDKQSSLK